jgi:CDP-4-dehydro-6-deoxyglucose reductase, E1
MMNEIIPGKAYIPVAHSNVFPEDREALHEVVATGNYSEGPRCSDFRRALEKYFGVPHAFLTNSGSSALLAALTAARERSKGRYVITSALNFPTTVSAIYQAGFQPWYLDCSPDTMQVDLDEVLESCEDDDVAGVVLAHTLGFPFDERLLAEQLRLREKFLVSDACDAWGAELFDPQECQWRKIGSFADMATLSGYPAHHINMGGEGGAILCRNGTPYPKIVRSIINWGRDCICEPGQDNACGNRFGHQEDEIPAGYDHKYIFSRLGYNLKATEFHGALGAAQMNHLPEFVNQRRVNFGRITNIIGQFDWLHILPDPFVPGSSPFGVPFRVQNAQPLIAYLEEHKIGTRRIFGGNLLRQPAFRSLPCRKADSYLGADILMRDALWIGCWPGWTEEMTEYVKFTLHRYEDEKMVAE